MSMLEEIWLGGLDYQDRPVKKGSAMERNGRATAVGKPLTVKPQKLIGKKEGSKISISGQSYVIKEIC